MDERLNVILDRIKQITTSPHDVPSSSSREHRLQPPTESANSHAEDAFIPQEPESFEDAGLTESEVEALIMKFLLARGDANGRDIAEQVKLPFHLHRSFAPRHEKPTIGLSSRRGGDERFSISIDRSWPGARPAIGPTFQLFRLRAGFAATIISTASKPNR